MNAPASTATAPDFLADLIAAMQQGKPEGFLSGMGKLDPLAEAILSQANLSPQQALIFKLLAGEAEQEPWLEAEGRTVKGHGPDDDEYDHDSDYSGEDEYSEDDEDYADTQDHDPQDFAAASELRGGRGTRSRITQNEGRRLISELKDLREVNDTLAAALGACHLCWGGDHDCEECGGRGRPGSKRPDSHLFKQLVVPAMARVRHCPKKTSTRARAGYEHHQKPRGSYGTGRI